MKFPNAFRLVAGLLAFALPIASAWSADQEKQSPSSLPGNPALAPADSQQAQQQPEVKAFMGKMSKNDQKLILEDAITNISYQLDDQKKAKQFEG